MIKKSSPLKFPLGWKRTPNPIPSRFGGERKPSIYNSSQKLKNELRLFEATEVTISSDMKVNNDGSLRSGQKKPDDTGVAVYFTWKGQQSVIACDTYDRCGCNLWAVARTIEAFRQMERDGCTEILNRSFSGLAALPEKASALGWWQVLKVSKSAEKGEIKQAYHYMLKMYHPDIPGTGDREKYDEVVRAYDAAMRTK